MGRFMDKSTGVTFSVDDSKDDRYAGEGFQPAEPDEKPSPRRPAKKTVKPSDDE